MNSDAELLRHYVETRSESAFTELVQRHVGLVYSVALRRVGGDAHLAEDVALRVFADLARKAANLRDRPTLGGWLYASAHLASASVVRSERRRKVRETEAHSMQITHSSSEPDWARLRPVIDDVVIALPDGDREAIALRFFEKRSFAEIGVALRVTEEAARKRVDRALDKLRALLGQRGITSTATALGLALGAIGAATAPAGLGGKLAGSALTAGSTASVTSSIVGTVWPAAVALLVGGASLLSESRSNDALRIELAQLEAEYAALARFRAENIGLARDVVAAEEFARRPRIPPPASPAAGKTVASQPPGRQIIANVHVTSRGTITWEGEPMALQEFVRRLQELQAAGHSSGRVNIRSIDSEFSPLAYVIDEIRKARIEHVTVESNAKPNPKLGWSWF